MKFQYLGRPPGNNFSHNFFFFLNLDITGEIDSVLHQQQFFFFFSLTTIHM